MRSPSHHPREAERQALLLRCDVLDTAPDPDFDGLTQLAAFVAGVPIALVSLVDSDRQWFKSAVGITAPETPRSISFCGHAILEEQPFMVADARLDERFRDNPLVVGDPHIVFYAGIPLRIGSESLPVGTLCVADLEPRELAPERLERLVVLARQVEVLLEHRLRASRLEEEIETAKRNRAERRRVEVQTQQFFELSLDLMAIATVEGRFVRVNSAWTQLLGWSSSELVSKPFLEWVHPDDHAMTIEATAALGTGAPVVDFENRYRCSDGSFKSLSWSCKTILEDGLIVCVARDITQRQARDEEMRRALDAAESADRAKSEFLATMSHEIRTPMNGVLGMTEVMLGTQLDGRQREMLETIRDSGHGLLDILNDILDWSRIEAGRLRLDVGPVDVATIARDVVSLLSEQAVTKGLVLDLDVEATSSALGDPGRVRQVLLNLVGNAVKFTERGSVHVRLSHEPPSAAFPTGSCLVTVTDTGIGMAAQTLERLFERFTQANSSHARRFGGSGLGLAISQQLVKMMNGTIAVESAIDRGSRFSVALPRTVPAASALEAPVHSLVVERGLHVLVAEDNMINQRITIALLERDGHRVELAENGDDAVALFKRGGWDLVLMDVQMPETDGLEATVMIRELERAIGGHVPIVALTASAFPEEQRACLSAGMDEVLAKPFTLDQLRRVLGRAA